MALLTLRTSRDSALTWEEGDANLLALDSDSPWKVSANHITYDGKVGIGVDSDYVPVYDLDFGNGDPSTVGITNGDLSLHIDGPNQFKVWNNTVQSITVATTGRVGINDSDPDEMLTVDGNIRASNTVLSNVLSANSITDGTLSISNGNITNAKRIVSTHQIDFTEFYDRSTGYRVDHIDSVIVNDTSGFPTTSAVYVVKEDLQNNINLLTDSLNNQVGVINGQFDSLNGKLQSNVNTLQGNINTLESELTTDINNLNTSLTNDINNLESSLTTDINNLNTSLTNDINNLSNSLASTNLQNITDVGSTTTNSITASSFVKSGGTSSQYLKADGSVSTDDDVTAGKVSNPFTVQGTAFDGSVAKTVTFTGGTGITVSGTTITNDLGGTPVSITGGGATSVSGSYPAFTISSTNTTYSAGTGLSLSGTTFTNTAPDQTVALTGSGATSVTGTYPNFTISSTDNNTTYTAGTGLSLSGTQFTNTAPDRTVSLTGSGATSVTGTYPNFTISSTDNNTTYSAGTGLSLSGTTFTNTAPDQTVSLTGAGGLTVSGSYPNFTLTQGSVGGYTLPLAASGTRGGVKIGYASSGKNYAVQLSSEKMFVNVPWTDNNTTYTAGNGLSLAGTEFKMSGSYTGTLTCTGDVVAFSDVALKSNINPITEALNKVGKITGYTYDKVGDEERRTGVLAQEIQKVLPEAVHSNEDGVLGVAYGNLTGLLIEAVKELSSKVKELESKIGV